MLQKNMTTNFGRLTDDELITTVQVLVATERRATAELVASLAELDARRLYLGAGCASLFTYCTQVLHLSESAAYARIEPARAMRRWPGILERLADGRLTLTSVCLLSRAMTDENHEGLLAEAERKSKRDVELIVARVRPQPAVPPVVRKLPAATAESAPAPQLDRSAVSIAPPLPAVAVPPPVPAAHRPLVQPLAPEIYKVQFTLSKEGHDRLRRAQDLMRHVVPNGDVAVVFERALTLLVEHLERRKLAERARPRAPRPVRPLSRHIPASVRREVSRRDGDRCAFVGTEGRCAERGFLEFHHVVPWADGGSTDVNNLQLRCRAHNVYEALLWSGADVVRERAPSWPAAP